MLHNEGSRRGCLELIISGIIDFGTTGLHISCPSRENQFAKKQTGLAKI